MDKPVAAPAVGAKEKIDKQARQLAYDTRYKVKQSMKAKSGGRIDPCLLYTSPSPRDLRRSRMPSSA